MFLNKDNSLKKKRLLFAGLFVLAVCLLGIFWFDTPVFVFMRGFNFGIWGALDPLFEAKNWLVISFVAGVLIFAKNELLSKGQTVKKTNRFSVRAFIIKIKEKSKGNFGLLTFYSVVLASAVAGVLKFALGRMRPIFFERFDITGFYPGTNEWAFNSMPSGHAAASFAGLVMIGLLFPKYKFFTWMLAIIIGVSRVCFGAHFPTDVILGAFIGMVSADLIKNKFNA